LLSRLRCKGAKFIASGHADSISLPVALDEIAKAVNDACSKPTFNRYVAYNWDIVVTLLTGNAFGQDGIIKKIQHGADP
jgi:hypothetical protein